MKTNRLFFLELERNSLRPYQIATIISTLFMIGFIYLMATIPRMDSSDSDTELFTSYTFIIGLTLVIMMGIFSIISATMASKFIVDEYTGKRVILLFSYPISRKKIMVYKILLVFLFTIISMFVSGICVITIFMLTEIKFPICNDNISLGLILRSVAYLTCYTLIAGFCGIISSWIGFTKKSIIATIVSSCIIMVFICQIVTMTFFNDILIILLLIVIGVISFFVLNSMLNQVEKMEI